MGGWWPHGFEERERGIGSSPMKSGGGLGQRTSPLLMTCLSSSCRCERQPQPVRYEPSLRGASAAAQARSPSGALALGSVVCGGGVHGTQVPICLASETPSHLILPTLPASQVTREIFSRHRGRVKWRVTTSTQRAECCVYMCVVVLWADVCSCPSLREPVTPGQILLGGQDVEGSCRTCRSLMLCPFCLNRNPMAFTR